MSPSKSAIAREVPPSQDAPPAATPRSAQTVQFTPGKPGQPAPGPHPLTPHPAAPQPDSPPPVATEPPIVVKKRRGGTRRFVMLVVIPLIALAVGFSWWLDGGRYVTTDNAYVGADKSLITPQVTGPIAAVHVVEGQRVEVGDPLFDIDPKPYRDCAYAGARDASTRRRSNSPICARPMRATKTRSTWARTRSRCGKPTSTARTTLATRTPARASIATLRWRRWFRPSRFSNSFASSRRPPRSSSAAASMRRSRPSPTTSRRRPGSRTPSAICATPTSWRRSTASRRKSPRSNSAASRPPDSRSSRSSRTRASGSTPTRRNRT